jgi:hypothetical protein
MSANDQTTTIPEAFFEGIVDRGSQKKVAVAVNVNFELKDGQRERGHAIPIHIVPLLRRAHPGGVVKVLSAWARGVPRIRELTQEELKTELEGMMRGYGVKLPGQAASLLAEVYGATEAEQLRNLHAKMGQVYRAWVDLERQGRERLAKKFPKEHFSELAIHGLLSQVISDEEMNALVTLIEPEREELEEIQLPELGAIERGEASVPRTDDEGGERAGGEAEDALAWLTTELTTQLKLDDQAALQLTAMAIESGDTDPEPERLASIKQLRKGDGTVHGKKIETLSRILKLYRQKLALATAET